ncbi:MAG: DUF1207 domain-containing protein [Thermoguttaceae bacterium]|nr:DUF1207 domain-containing protein [Thermoguttaceae bacterium]
MEIHKKMFEVLSLTRKIIGVVTFHLLVSASLYAQQTEGAHWDFSTGYDPSWGATGVIYQVTVPETGAEWGEPLSQAWNNFGGRNYIPQSATYFADWEDSVPSQEYGSDPSLWQTQILPKGVLYPAYLAGRKESRLQSIFTHESGYGWLWDISLGGRVPLFRFGTSNLPQPEGFQIDMEGAALLRLDFERNRNLASTDYRAGLPITYGTKFWQLKTGYYHVSSHLGDNYLLDRFQKKVHYVRDEIFLGIALKPVSSVRLYGEAGWAFNAGETTSPWELQFGVEFSPQYSNERMWRGSPFAAVHGHLFQELDFGGYVNSQIGWQWRRPDNGLFRLGAEFYCGCDDQYQFHYAHQKKIGLGLWYDF